MKRFDSLHPLLFFFPQIQQSDKKDFSESFSSRYICATRPQSFTFFSLNKIFFFLETIIIMRRRQLPSLLIDKKALRSQYYAWQSNRHIFFWGSNEKKKKEFYHDVQLNLLFILRKKQFFPPKKWKFLFKKGLARLGTQKNNELPVFNKKLANISLWQHRIAFNKETSKKLRVATAVSSSE